MRYFSSCNHTLLSYLFRQKRFVLALLKNSLTCENFIFHLIIETPFHASTVYSLFLTKFWKNLDFVTFNQILLLSTIY